MLLGCESNFKTILFFPPGPVLLVLIIIIIIIMTGGAPQWTEHTCAGDTAPRSQCSPRHGTYIYRHSGFHICMYTICIGLLAIVSAVRLATGSYGDIHRVHEASSGHSVDRLPYATHRLRENATRMSPLMNGRQLHKCKRTINTRIISISVICIC